MSGASQLELEPLVEFPCISQSLQRAKHRECGVLKHWHTRELGSYENRLFIRQALGHISNDK